MEDGVDKLRHLFPASGKPTKKGGVAADANSQQLSLQA